MTRLPHSFRSSATLLASLLTCAVLLGGLPQTGCAAEAEEPTKPAVKSRAAADAKAEKKAGVKNPFPNRVPSADLDGGVEWLNTSGEINLKDLRGKVVLLDFWTYCCINCIHVLPDLKYLEKKFGKELVVIGVHSAKFDNEKESGNIRKAILRYEIEHPVINDAKMTVWRKFGVNSWPSMVLIDPEGFYCGHLSGEGNREVLEQVITKVIDFHKAKGTLDETPVSFDLERNKQTPGPLKFPGKILADEPGQRLFISDSNHNRIVIAGLDGQLVDVIGDGQIGAKDGSYTEAQFDHPQGMCLVNDTLYVADTENHTIRTIDLKAKTVATLAGNGKQANFRAAGGKLLQTSLNSPWDLYAIDDMLYIAMAGPHQMWSHQFGADSIHPYAGSGREDIKNGSLKDSALAQPSGIASDGSHLFVVDSEGSSVRQIVTKGVAADGQDVSTLVGASDLPNGQTLFAFGDIDGVGDEVRLQHPLGIVFHKGKLFVADTYNHKIKLVDVASKATETWVGTGKPGTEIDPLQLAEPAGLTIAGNSLFIADTNNHRILKVDLDTKQAAEFVVTGLTPPATADESTAASDEPSDGVTTLPIQQIKPGEPLELTVEFQLPEDYKLNAEIPVKYALQSGKNQTLIAAELIGKKQTVEIADGVARVRIPVAAKSGAAELTLTMTYGYCREGTGGLCKLATSAWKIPVVVSEDAKTESLSLTASPK